MFVDTFFHLLNLMTYDPSICFFLKKFLKTTIVNLIKMAHCKPDLLVKSFKPSLSLLNNDFASNYSVQLMPVLLFD